MTAPTPIPDAAVEAYLRASNEHYRKHPVLFGDPGSGVQDATRAGLAAALPHLVPAAPSGETAPNLCGHTIAGVLGRVLMCSRPAGHDGAHNDPSGAQWGEVPAGEEMAAVSVPAACTWPTAEHERQWLEAVDRKVAEMDARACPAEYPECPERHRRCDQPAGHPGSLHYNRAGFAWSDEEASESAARVTGGTDAQATPADVLRIAADTIRSGMSGHRAAFTVGQLLDLVMNTLFGMADEIERRSAAPSGEQPTTELVGEVPDHG